MECNEVAELAALLRRNGDEILNAASKLLLSTSLLHQLNEAFNNLAQLETFNSAFQVLDYSNRNTSDEPNVDVEFLHDIVQKTVALKLVPDSCTCITSICSKIDINRFKMLKLLELHRINVRSICGLEKLKSCLEYVICVRGLQSLKDFLVHTNDSVDDRDNDDEEEETVWVKLKEAIFKHNNIENLDSSLKFAPSLHTLDLSHNRIQNAQALECLPNLKHLNLGFNKIESVPVFNSRLCDQLQTLVLRNNYLEDLSGLFVLTNLCELDLSCNCLMEHNALTPVTQLKLLRNLNLQGNPLSFHPKHRLFTCPYLHRNAASSEFLLDSVALKRGEQALVGKVHPIHLAARAPSMSSSTSEATVIASPDATHYDRFQPRADYIQTSDMEVSTHSNMSMDVPNVAHHRDEYTTVLQDGIGMQDSGFVASARPISPSECSIDSIMTIASENEDLCAELYARKCESDIEVISNPSQSSIEVLDGGASSRSIPAIKEATNTQQMVHGDNNTNVTTISDLNSMAEPRL